MDSVWRRHVSPEVHARGAQVVDVGSAAFLVRWTGAFCGAESLPPHATMPRVSSADIAAIVATALLESHHRLVSTGCCSIRLSLCTSPDNSSQVDFAVVPCRRAQRSRHSHRCGGTRQRAVATLSNVGRCSVDTRSGHASRGTDRRSGRRNPRCHRSCGNRRAFTVGSSSCPRHHP